MAVDFANGCDPGNTGVAFKIGDTPSEDWQFYTIESSSRGYYVIVMRKPLADEVFAHHEQGDPMEDPSGVDFAELTTSINCAEYILVMMSHDGQEIKISQGTVIQDDDTFDGQTLDTWDRFDRLIDGVFAP
jgi:hypothetical protein